MFDRLTKAREHVLIADGAMGTELVRLGMPAGDNLDRANLTRPELVLEVHRQYLAAGAGLIETNTFGANGIRLTAAGLITELEAINRAGVRLAREAADGRDALVAGAVGPPGAALAPIGNLSPAEAREAFKAQSAILAAEGVDLILLETFAGLDEILLAAEAALATGLPVIASLAFSAEGFTAAGVSAKNAAIALAKLGVAGVGANCGAGPEGLCLVAEEMAPYLRADQLLCLMPNAGLPQRVEGRTVFRSQPEYFAAAAERLWATGANLIGGCCGSGAEHIAALSRVLAGRPVHARAERPPAPAAAQAQEDRQLSPFLAKLKNRQFLCTVELSPPKGPDPAELLHAARALRHAGADAVDVADGPMARVRMGSIALAHRLQEEAGVDVLLHLTCRDRNLIGLQADLLGAAALGVRNILALTGDPPSAGDHPQATAVFDVNATGLVKIMAGFNQGFDLAGNALGRATEFAIGVAANPGAADLEKELARLAEKFAAGADYALTQPVFAPELVRPFLTKAAERGWPLLIGLWPLRSLRQAEYLANEVPGITIPPEIIGRMAASAPAAQPEVGLAIVRETLEALRPLCAGVCLMPGGNLELALALLRVVKTVG